MNPDANTDTPVADNRETVRTPIANPFIPGPTYDLARAYQLVQSDPELAHLFAEQAGVDLGGAR